MIKKVRIIDEEGMELDKNIDAAVENLWKVYKDCENPNIFINALIQCIAYSIKLSFKDKYSATQFLEVIHKRIEDFIRRAYEHE